MEGKTKRKKEDGIAWLTADGIITSYHSFLYQKIVKGAKVWQNKSEANGVIISC